MIAPDEKFCGSCGAPRLEHSAAPVATDGGSAVGSPAASDPASAVKEAAKPSEQEEGSAGSAATNDGESPADKVSPPQRSITTGDLLGDGDTIPPVPHTVRAAEGSGKHSKAKQLDAGTSLNGRYEIVRRIGGGGMGAVYLARDRNLGDAPRAVKEMIESHIDDTQHEKAISDFKRESLLLTSLEHPSIPTIYDYFYDDAAGRFYLVMKYISGGDFSSRLRNAPGGRVDEKNVTDWGIQIADVLHYLHTRPKPIIYRDLKPANLMIDGNSGRVMLIDFGIARWVTKQEKGVTAVGTMGYAPPELFSGQVEPRSDVYSLGATMFHLVTGFAVWKCIAFMGAFTTFSSFAFETGALMRDSQWLLAAANMLASNILGLVFLFLGIALGKLF